jgi:hypothetical protein
MREGSIRGVELFMRGYAAQAWEFLRIVLTVSAGDLWSPLVSDIH